MPWVRIDENAMDDPKFIALTDGAWRLWCEGQAYCQRHLTDGLIPVAVLKGFRYYSTSRMKCLLTVHVPGKAAIWHQADDGIHVHDYLDWNDSREHVIEARKFAKVRMALVRDPELRKAIQARDGNHCRYCGRQVNWHDRKGATGATYDHVIPDGSDDLANLVVACRGCNSRKGQRTPDQAGMTLIGSRSDLNINLDKSTYHTTPHHTTPRHQNKEPPATSRSKRPIFQSTRFVVFDWQLDDLRKLLGPHFEEFDIHEWFFALSAKADAAGMVVPQRDGGKWLQEQTLAEAVRRGLPVAAEGIGMSKRTRALLQSDAEFLKIVGGHD